MTNQTGVDSQGRRTIDLLAAAPGVTLRAVFSPEHGLLGQVDASVPHGRDPATGLPVWSLYGATRRPSSEMLAGIDTIVFDVQDVGARYYTYLTTLVYMLEEAAKRRLSVVVLDRPNPVTGRVVEGPVMDADLRSFTAPHEIPVRPGMTIGEFALMVVAERKLRVDLTVIPLENWERSRWFDQTGLAWVNPSPNIRSPNQALLYSGIGLLETTNLSVGRGTDMPFEVIGAPWIDPLDLSTAMNQKGLVGVRFEPIAFTPNSSVYAGQGVGGVRFVVTNRDVAPDGDRRARPGPRARRSLPDPVPSGGDPEPPREPDHHVVLPARRSLAADDELGGGGPGELPPAPRVVPHLPIEVRRGPRRPPPNLPQDSVAPAKPALERGLFTRARPTLEAKRIDGRDFTGSRQP